MEALLGTALFFIKYVNFYKSYMLLVWCSFDVVYVVWADYLVVVSFHCTCYHCWQFVSNVVECTCRSLWCVRFVCETYMCCCLFKFAIFFTVLFIKSYYCCDDHVHNSSGIAYDYLLYFSTLISRVLRWIKTLSKMYRCKWPDWTLTCQPYFSLSRLLTFSADDPVTSCRQISNMA